MIVFIIHKFERWNNSIIKFVCEMVEVFVLETWLGTVYFFQLLVSLVINLSMNVHVLSLRHVILDRKSALLLNVFKALTCSTRVDY